MQNNAHRKECSVPLCKSKQVAEVLSAAPITYSHLQGKDKVTESSTEAYMASQKYRVKRWVKLWSKILLQNVFDSLLITVTDVKLIHCLQSVKIVNLKILKNI